MSLESCVDGADGSRSIPEENPSLHLTGVESFAIDRLDEVVRPLIACQPGRIRIDRARPGCGGCSGGGGRVRRGDGGGTSTSGHGRERGDVLEDASADGAEGDGDRSDARAGTGLLHIDSRSIRCERRHRDAEHEVPRVEVVEVMHERLEGQFLPVTADLQAEWIRHRRGGRP